MNTFIPKKNLKLDDRKQIEELIKQPISLSDIARLIGRAKNTVITEVRINGGREKYRAIEAQKRSYEAYMIRRDTLRKHDPNSRFQIESIITRLSSLEMQMDIILDIIKQLENKL